MDLLSVDVKLDMIRTCPYGGMVMIQPPGGSRAKWNPGGQILIRRSPRQRRVRTDLPSFEADHHMIPPPRFSGRSSFSPVSLETGIVVSAFETISVVSVVTVISNHHAGFHRGTSAAYI